MSERPPRGRRREQEPTDVRREDDPPAGVREPRRPKPKAPAGAAARELELADR